MNLAGFGVIVDVDLIMSFQMSVEVERKFVCNADTLKRLEEIGGMDLICLSHSHEWVHLQLRQTNSVTHINILSLRDLYYDCCDIGHSNVVNNKVKLWVTGSVNFHIDSPICSIITLSSIHFLYLAVCVDQRQFEDQYFDTPDFDLTLRDMWLRKRNKDHWELKCQAADRTEEMSRQQAKAAALCTQYKEITNLPEIQLKVKEVLKEFSECETSSSQGDECWLGKMNLVCFAVFTTERRSFALAEEGVQIDLDHADFGYSVGEIEVLVPQGDVRGALEKIERMAQKLGELNVV